MKHTTLLIAATAALFSLCAQAADVKTFGGSTDTRWTATSSDACANGSTITLDGLTVTIGNSEDKDNSWSWNSANNGIIPTQMPSTDGTASTLITSFSETAPYDTLPTRGCYLVLKPTKPQTVIITAKHSVGDTQDFVLATVEDDAVTAAKVSKAADAVAYSLEAGKTYYFFQLAKSGNLTSYRFTLRGVSVDINDIQSLITNADFQANSTNGWTWKGTSLQSKISFTEKGGGIIAGTPNYHWQLWGQNKTISGKAIQTINCLPNGVYTIGVTLVADFPTGYVRLFGNGNTKNVATGQYGKYTVDATVTDGTLSLGLDVNIVSATGDIDLEIDDFTLAYKEPLGEYGGEVSINELETEAHEAIDNVKVTLQRTLSSTYWNTFSVPFDISDISSLGSVEELESVTDNVLKFKDATSIEAGKPYLVRPDSDLVNPTFEKVNITATAGSTDGNDDYKFAAQLYNNTLSTDGSVAYLSTDGTVERLASGGSIKGLRAYFLIPSSSSAKAYIAFPDGATTGIDAIHNWPAAQPTSQTSSLKPQTVYDLSGRRHHVGPLPKGIYIVNGKKIVK